MSSSNRAISKLPSNYRVVVLGGILVIFTMLLIFNFWKVFQGADHDARYLELTSNLRVLSQQIATNSRAATEGDASAFDKLANARTRFQSDFDKLKSGDNKVPSPEEYLGEELASLEETLVQLQEACSHGRTVRECGILGGLSSELETPEPEDRHNHVPGTHGPGQN